MRQHSLCAIPNYPYIGLISSRRSLSILNYHSLLAPPQLITMDSSPITRVVTGHLPDGTAIVTRLDAIPPQPAGFGINIASLWSTAKHPASVDSDNDKALHNWGLSPPGTVFNAVDFPPRTKTPLHRSLTVDYLFLHRGTLVLHLDDGSRSTLKEGDVAVVQAGMHSWENPTDETARAVAVMVAAEAPIVAGKTLEAEVSDANP
jgi:quercetin dioxygenase-like cupin family protein